MASRFFLLGLQSNQHKSYDDFPAISLEEDESGALFTLFQARTGIRVEQATFSKLATCK
jgi:hypothetical protein